ncbi:hypothetical protein CAEBREN_14578 [Caenorhabditis brenneri]|uniref:Uncharacterized protein n=1 Tax=Caenorhabditis brenneri TaxID=135651 RepID=G0MVU8_CAEBE|nr:hypothetical protein CAEBREN_14578 [Caenorhabditis brenneri]
MLLVPSLCDNPPNDGSTTLPPMPDMGSPEEFLKEVNEYRAKFAREHHISNMYKLAWNESLVEVLKSLDLKIGSVGIFQVSSEYLSSSDSSWDGFGNNWRITELVSFSAAVVAIDEDVHSKSVLNRKIKGKEENIDTDEMIHPLQTSIGCMKKEREKNGEKYVLTACLLGNMGQWPTDFKLDANSKKIPGSECMDGYVNDDGLCVLAPPMTTPRPTEAHTSPKDRATEAVPAIPKNPDALDEKEKEGASVEKDAELKPGQEALESSSVTTRNYSYGLLILMFICLLF